MSIATRAAEGEGEGHEPAHWRDAMPVARSHPLRLGERNTT